ncbi:hypothetical protein SSP35_18_00890 [Streptomyces sp. NBRC 110611]|uniref:hypothetical protein n=1 Tax=Streptomyces sp. NBRC 110611 TaxID=1621259 RepID=UPI000832054E|nr:hypothetical protein [Streptomyces sp. NBRC 110611]GAU70361.1 hypothetical protein SSP35_18_00890 [Streptomyces sp. NBRC 110611]
MQINWAEAQPGTALLLAAAPAGKGRLLDANSVVPALAAIPPSAWAAATLIELTDPTEPQAVLTRIRAAAATSGPLTIVLVGQLQLDRRQHAVHLALARTTPATTRYTALPWSWLIRELRQRRPGTTLYADLVADAEVWEQLLDEPLPFGNSTVYGVISPPPGRRRIAQPRYMHALAQILRTGRRGAPDQLHHAALHRVDTEGAIVLGPEQPAPAQTMPTPAVLPAIVANVPEPPGNPALAPAPATPPRPEAQASPPLPDQRAVPPVHVPGETVIPAAAEPHEQIAALSKAGRHREAAELAAAAEQRAVRTYGADTYAAVHWIEVRAFITSVAQDHSEACQLWLQAAEARLDTLQQAPDARDVETAVDGAHHQWMHLRDATAARALATRLMALRHRVPGRQRGALESLQKTLARLNGPSRHQGR